MLTEQIKTELNKIFCEVFDDENIKIFPEMTANDVDEWDSLNHINIIVAVERKFDIKFTTKEIMTYENVGQFISSLEEKIESKGK